MKYRVVLFDFDGTLADTLPRSRELFNALADKHGYRKFTAEEALRLRDLHGQELLREMGISMWRLPGIVRDMRKVMQSHAHEFTLFTGTTEMLTQLRQAGLRLGIVSSNSEENVRLILRDNAPLFEIFTCDVSMFGKTAKLRATAKAMKVAPGEILYVGDEVRDAEAAQGAGMDYGAVGWGQHTLQLLGTKKPSLSFERMNDIAAKLAGASGK